MSVSTTEMKTIFEMNREELADYNQNKLVEFKELFLTTDLPVDEIYSKLNVDKGDPTYRYIEANRNKEGLSAKDRKVKFNLIEQSSSSTEFEEFYQEFRKIWIIHPDISKAKAFKKLGKQYKANALGKYVNSRLQEEDLPVNHAKNISSKWIKPRKRAVKNIIDESEYETKYQEYKEFFEDTDLLIRDIYEQIGVSQNNQGCGGYILKRAKEDGLDSMARKKRINSKKSKNKPYKKHKKTKSKRGRPPKNQPSDEKLERSMKLLNQFFQERNIKSSTRKGYIASLRKWLKFVNYSDLKECIDCYIEEEDNRIPTRERKIKKEMLEFREHLLNDKEIKSDKSVRSYFSKIGTVLRHFGLEIPQLPQVKMEKGYVSNYNDLPTKDMIKQACEQSPIELSSLILFMSSSGSAKAETLSITVGMFFEGCEDYLEEAPNMANIPETIEALSGRHDIVPLIYLRRIKTDKWYYTCCSPEASYLIVESLKIRKDLKWDDKLFDFTSSLLLTRFQEINDNNKWGYVGAYRRFRSHALRKFMASNIGLPRDQVDSFQGRAKDMIQEAYFKQDPQSLKKIYMEVMHRVMVYENWGHGTSLAEIESQKKRLHNNFKDDEKIIDLSTIPETPDEIKTSIGLETDTETTGSVDRSTINVKQNKGNSLPVTAPSVVPVGHVGSVSVSKELLNYAELMEKGLLSIAEFNRVKQKLLIEVLR